MKHITKSALFAAWMLLVSNSTLAASFGSIGVSFLGDTDGGNTAPWQLAPADLAGVAPQTNWNNINCNVGSNPPYTGVSDPLVDNVGNVTAIQLQFFADDAWNGNGPIVTPNDKLMKGVLKHTPGGSMVLIFANVPNDSYEIYVYGDVDTGPQSLDVNIDTRTSYWMEPDAYNDATGFIEATNFSDPASPGAGNYVRFAGVTPASDGTITIYVTPQSGDLGIAGLQIVSSTGLPVAIVRQPQSASAVVGWPAIFAVQYSGSSASIQWFSNNVAIPGATNASYKTPPVTLSYNGALYKVTISNSLNSVTSAVVTLTVVTDPGTRVAMIGASFLGNGPNGTATWRLAPADLAGVVPQTNWNNLDCNVAGIPADVGTSELLDSTGKFTAAQLHFVANDAWNSDGLENNANRKLMKGILKTDAAMTLIFVNLPPAVYDVYVYGAVDSGPADLDASIGALTSYWTEPASFTSGFNNATSFNPGARTAGNYVKFAGATPVNGEITVTASYQGNGPGSLGIAGLQLVSSVVFPTNTLPIAITRQPQPTLAATGSNATFVAQVSGPFPRFQWFSNSVAIPGATGASYTTPPVNSGFNGAKYKVAITNNVNSVTSYEAPLTVRSDTGTRIARIGASFLGDGGDTSTWLLTSADEAGVVPQTNWNNINCNVGSVPPDVGVSDPLLDNAGNVTAVQLQFLANDAWNSDGPIDTPNDKLMKGLLKEGNGVVGSTMTLTFWNLAPAFYDVYLYGNVNAGPANLSVSIGTTTYDWIEPAAFDDPTGFIDASDPLSSGIGNYVRYTGVTPVSGAITIGATYLGGSDGLGISGLQLVSSAAFPTSPNLAAALQGGQLVLSWNSPINFQLQYQTALGQGIWINEPTSPVVSGNQVTVRLPATGPARFFRLVISP